LYLPSKLKFKYIAVLLTTVLLFFLPFKKPLSAILMLFLRPITFTPEYYKTKIDNIEKENLSLLLSLENTRTLEDENQKLKKALDFKQKSKFTFIGAEAIAYSPSNWTRSALLNVGIEDGIKNDLFAVSSNGNLLGKISDATEKNCRLTFINDPNFSLTVFIGKETVGLLKGNLIGAKILYIENDQQLRIGERVWVKNPGLPEPIEIGTIKSAKRNSNNLFWSVSVQLPFKNTLFEQVFIIKLEKND